MEIRNARTKKELVKKRKEFYGTLKLEADNNERLRKAMEGANEDKKLGITPLAPKERSLQEEEADTVKQRVMAFNFLKELMKADEANRFLDRLQPAEYFELNSLSGIVQKKLTGRSNLDAVFLYNFYRRLVASERRKGAPPGVAPPPPPPPPVGAAPPPRGNPPPPPPPPPLFDSDEDSDDSDGDGGGGAGSNFNTPPPPRRRRAAAPTVSPRRRAGKRRTGDDEGGGAASKKQNKNTKGDKRKSGKADPEYELGSKKIKPTEVKRKRNARYVYPQKEQRTDDDARGSGLTVLVKQKTVKIRGRTVVGRGIEPVKEEKYQQFGRYLLHVPSLKKGILNLKYPSLASIPSLPQRILSQDLSDFIQEVISNGEMNQKLFDKLSETDRNLFAKVAQQSLISDKLGLKNSVGEDDRELLKRFELVRGEVIAGNNSTEILKELKGLTLQLLADGRISKSIGHTLLYELSLCT